MKHITQDFRSKACVSPPEGNHECRSMVAIFFLPDPYPTPYPPPPTHTHTHTPWGLGQKVKIQFLQNMVMLNIKLKTITNAATQYQIFCLQTPLPWGWGQ